MNKNKIFVVTTTFAGLVCGLVLTQQQASAATENSSIAATNTTLVAQPKQQTNGATTTQNFSAPAAPTNTQTRVNQPVINDNSTSNKQPNTAVSTNTLNTGTTINSAGLVNNEPITSTETTSHLADVSQQTPVTNNQQSGASIPTNASQSVAPLQSVNPASATGTNTDASTTPTDSQAETIAQGTWGTSKWEFTHQGDDYILHFHTGTLGESSHDERGLSGSIGASKEVFNGNQEWNNELTQIIIDPGVIANQDSSYLFACLSNLKSIIGLTNLDTKNVTDMHEMFSRCYSLTSLDFSHFNTGNVTDMSSMFSDCGNMTSLDLDSFNTANVTDMSFMFAGCRNLTSLDLSNFNTANVTDMSSMFTGCDITHLDLSSFDTSNVTNMSFMFAGCNMTNLDVSHFNTSNVTDMSSMFYDCRNLTSLDLSNFDTSKVTHMDIMFGDCRSLTSLDISNFNSSKIGDESASITFHGCVNLNHLILGPKLTLALRYIDLPDVPQIGTRIPGTNKFVISPYWVATSGYQRGHKYTPKELTYLKGRDQVTTYDWDSIIPFTNTTETITKNRTIVIHQPDGNTQTEIQSAMTSRLVTINTNGSKAYGDWSPAQWDAYMIPEYAGYTASQNKIPAQKVDEDTFDQTIDIYYEPQEQTIEIQYLSNGKVVGTQKLTGYIGDTVMPNYHAPQGYDIISINPATITFDGSGKQIIQVQVSPRINISVEHKTLTRTINLHRPDGTMRTYKQTALLERQVSINSVTGEKIYGTWDTGNWNAFNTPQLVGYTASQEQVVAQQVTDQDTDQIVDIYYIANN